VTGQQLTLSAWPLGENELSVLLRGVESDLHEFKREWPDLRKAEGKATLAKDVLALANTARPQQPAFLVFGVDDERRGAEIVGISEPPDPETVSQILASYVQPPADVRCRHHTTKQKVISVLGIFWSAARPHHSIREFPGLLARDLVYVRRDRIIGTLTLPEIESMIRDKDARLGPLLGNDPVQFGFVNSGDPSSGIFLVRITNVTDEPVGGVDLILDARSPRNPELFHRERRFSNLTLGPRESREVDFKTRDIVFYLARFGESSDRKWTSVRPGAHVGDWWLNITLHLNFRDRSGFIKHLEQTISLDG
jgi:hypothetical protein